MAKQSIPFSRREWLMSMLLFLGIEYCLISASYAFKDENSVIAYISFAATIASLILAVVAIIYTFIQSEGQKKSADSIENQVEGLKEVGSELSEVTKTVTDEIKRMAIATDRLANLDNKIDASLAKIASLEDGISTIRGSQADIARRMAAMTRESLPRKRSARAREIEDQLEFSPEARAMALLRNTSHNADLFGYFLDNYFNIKEDARPVVEKAAQIFGIALSKAWKQATQISDFPGLFVGWELACAADGLGILHWDTDGPYTSPVVSEIKKCADLTRKSDAKLVVEGRVAIDEAIADFLK